MFGSKSNQNKENLNCQRKSSGKNHHWSSYDQSILSSTSSSTKTATYHQRMILINKNQNIKPITSMKSIELINIGFYDQQQSTIYRLDDAKNRLQDILERHSNRLMEIRKHSQNDQLKRIKRSNSTSDQKHSITPHNLFDGDAILNSFLLNNGGYLDDSDDDDDDDDYLPSPIGLRRSPTSAAVAPRRLTQSPLAKRTNTKTQLTSSSSSPSVSNHHQSTSSFSSSRLMNPTHLTPSNPSSRISSSSSSTSSRAPFRSMMPLSPTLPWSAQFSSSPSVNYQSSSSYYSFGSDDQTMISPPRPIRPSSPPKPSASWSADLLAYKLSQPVLPSPPSFSPSPSPSPSSYSFIHQARLRRLHRYQNRIPSSFIFS